MKKILILIFLFLIHLTNSQPSLQITTSYGDVIGSVNSKTGGRKFLGIPYAKPPIGDLRFKPPQIPEKWTVARDAKTFGSPCFQKNEPFIIHKSAQTNQSEDCLYLNVWTPANAIPDSKLNVMVFIHGGSYTDGSGNEPNYDGSNLSTQKNIVLVNMNYRLGVFGFMASDLLDKEDPSHPTSGNYGLLDQNLALKWVKENIKNFGGDPDSVTIFGESAGSYSVCYHLLMPLSQNLFKRAIMQSGSCAFPLFEDPTKNPNKLLDNQSFSANKQMYTKIMKELGCSDLSCMRNLSSIAIQDYTIHKNVQVWPVVDRNVIPDDPITLFKQGSFNNADIIFGTTTNEGTLFIPTEIQEKEFTNLMKSLFPRDSSKLLEAYPFSLYKNYRMIYEAIFTDFYFLCPGRQMINYIKRNKNSAKVYQYKFSHIRNTLSNENKQLFGAYHISEISFVFNNPIDSLANPLGNDFDKVEATLANLMGDLWTSFSKTGDPVYNSSYDWKEYFTSDKKYYLNLNTPNSDKPVLEVLTDLQKEKCDLYDEIIPMLNMNDPSHENSTKFYDVSILLTLLALLIIF